MPQVVWWWRGGDNARAVGGQGDIVVGSVLASDRPAQHIREADARRHRPRHKGYVNHQGGYSGASQAGLRRSIRQREVHAVENQLALQDKAGNYGGIASAAREAIRPVVARTSTLYFYNEQYAGLR